MKLDVQYIDHASARERLVILPERQFRVLELAAANGLAALKKNREDVFTLPAAIERRILAGENPVRAIRQWRGFSGRFLAKLVGITPSMLSQIECTGKTGSTRTFKAIAEALCVPVDMIFPKEAPSAQDAGDKTAASQNSTPGLPRS
ncbi:hypothetical protein SAMN04488498_112119 [Mesorhizobium albiziae]|uniref:HTH cro/C1-type domain-containing protein n=1 Tax=Neomesorhizobium albiziae TaxID=335020 RepID=A0A1I4CCL9_9HYPH|nr:helix-turn-helix transcriptional regulator [Mesorhizobium albiziae]SFK78057.1 hypothetical protein SAMN04488498_112119 [Mesorhizobium albiziae]